MSGAEWAAWRKVTAHDRVSMGRRGRKADRPCVDCDLGWAADMRLIDRCNGEPGGIEEDDEELDAADG